VVYDEPVSLTILVKATKSLDDVIRIARVEGRKKLRCNVRLIDVKRECEGKFVVLVSRKCRSLDVGALSGMATE
jgi:hypothetical protein